MSARRVLAVAAGAGLLLALSSAPARAQDSVLVRVGGDLAARAGQYLDVPVTVDLSGAPGRALGSYTAAFTFDPTVFTFYGITSGNFASPSVNDAHAADSGKVLVTAIQPSGATGLVQIFIARLYVLTDTLASPINISFSEMSASATSVTPYESLLGLLRIVNGTFCRSLGRWGDVNADGSSNSFDALVALSDVVGDTIPVSLNAALADVDGDGRVTSRDALIILSYAVGLPVPGTRVLLTAAGACGTGVAITLTVTPDSLELQVGQEVPVSLAALDSTGRAVPVDSITWVSSDPSIAGFDAGTGKIQARAPGVATLTAQLSPGIAGALKVSVLARRTTWYVDVEHAKFAPVQTGSQALPFEFINDALYLAHAGDTVRVASGIYEETVSGSVAVLLLGDSASRPILDPRGDPFWYGDAVYLSPGSDLIELANLDIRAGMVYLVAHDVVVRNVRIQGLSTTGWGLDIYSSNLTTAAGLRRSGPMRSAGAASPGNVLVDGVVVSGDSLDTGIAVEQADSVVIRNSTVSRALAGTDPYCGVGAYVGSGILVAAASVSLIQNNTVTNPVCQGVGAFDAGSGVVLGDVGRVTVSGNRVRGAPGTGIAAGARLVAFDHNVLDSAGLVPGMRSYGAAAAIHVITIYPAGVTVAPDSVVSLGDSVLNSGSRGFVVDTAGAAVLDSLVVSGTGLDSSGTANGVELVAGGRLTLRHSHISQTIYSEAVYFSGEHAVLESRGNHIAYPGDNGLSTYTTCFCAGPVRATTAYGGPAPMRAGAYMGGPDTLISISDTIVGANDAIYMTSGVFALVDSAVVDSSVNTGIYLQFVGRASVSHSAVRASVYSAGLYTYYVDTLAVLDDSVVGNVTGLDLRYALDSVTVRRTVVNGNGSNGIALFAATARIDSTVIANNRYGLQAGGSGVRVRWSRFQNNAVGLWMTGTSSYSSRVDSSSFMLDSVGAQNSAGLYDTLYAANNWWNDANGPACDSVVTGYTCPGGTTADTIVTAPNYGPILFSPPLGGAAPTPAAPARPLFVSAVRPAALAPMSSLAVERWPEARATEQDVANARSRSVRSAEQAAAAWTQRSERQQPQAWHAPSKARSHAVHAVIKKRH